MRVIKHSRKSLLFFKNEAWTKKSSNNCFDVTMGSYDGAEICELVGLHILDELSKILNKNDTGLYRDDGLIVLKNKKPFLVIGSLGGSTIITTIMQVILNVVVFGMDIKEAVSSPRFHSQWLPDMIMTEPRGLSKDVIKTLVSRGHTLTPYRWGYIGEANGILIGKNGFYGGGDTRGETSSAGY